MTNTYTQLAEITRKTAWFDVRFNYAALCELASQKVRRNIIGECTLADIMTFLSINGLKPYEAVSLPFIVTTSTYVNPKSDVDKMVVSRVALFGNMDHFAHEDACTLDLIFDSEFFEFLE